MDFPVKKIDCFGPKAENFPLYSSFNKFLIPANLFCYNIPVLVRNIPVFGFERRHEYCFQDILRIAIWKFINLKTCFITPKTEQVWTRIISTGLYGIWSSKFVFFFCVSGKWSETFTDESSLENRRFDCYIFCTVVSWPNPKISSKGAWLFPSRSPIDFIRKTTMFSTLLNSTLHLLEPFIFRFLYRAKKRYAVDLIWHMSKERFKS